jgi:hypothetical protein
VSLYERTASLDIGPEGGTGVHITGVRIGFRVQKTATRSINSANIDIFNLSQTTREQIANTDNIVVVNAGYVEGSGEEIVFRGDIDRFVHKHSPPDKIFNIEAGDGERVLRQTRIAVSFIGGTYAQEVLDEIVDQLPGIAVREYDFGYEVEFANGWSFVGPAADGLDKIARSLEAAWSLQNNEIQIVDIQGNNQTEAIHLSPTTGLIGSPEKLDDLENQLEEKKRPPGFRVQTLLMPKIEPRGIVSIESSEITGLFTVESVEHIGDTHGQAWTSLLEVFEEQD